jgi:hypothetical protein
MAEQCHGCIVAGAVFQFVRLNSSAALLTNLRRGLECLYFIDIFRGIKLGLCSILSFLNSWIDGVASTNAAPPSPTVHTGTHKKREVGPIWMEY